MELPDIDLLLKAFDEGEKKVRQQSISAIGKDVLASEADLQGLMFVLVGLIGKKKIGEKTDGYISLLLLYFWQGARITNESILTGQYLKAAASLKQELEICARLGELEAGVESDKTPNVKYGPPATGRLYGMLNELAHVSKPGILQELSNMEEKEDSKSISPHPRFSAEIAKGYWFYRMLFWGWIIKFAKILATNLGVLSDADRREIDEKLIEMIQKINKFQSK